MLNTAHRYINISWLIRHFHDHELELALPYARGSLLDIGCGIQPRRDQFKPYVGNYVGIDLPLEYLDFVKQRKIDVLANGLYLPFCDCSFETVLSMQVLEHVRDPFRFYQEIARVLKPGGCVLLSTNLDWPLHEEPHDFFRFTKYGLRMLAENVGLRVEWIHAEGGFWATVSQLYSMYFFTSFGAHLPKPIRWVVLLWVSFIQLLGLAVDRLHHDERNTLNYFMVARKDP